MTRLEQVSDLQPSYDVVVVGAGPAGMAAATEAAAHGLEVLLVDEAVSPGGQIFRAITQTPLRNREVLGEDYWRGRAAADSLLASGVHYLPGATVWHLDAGLQFGLSVGGRAAAVTARRAVLATGALERPFPVKGWTLPGVMSAGAAQTLLKASGMVPQGRVVLAGTGPLLWLLASQLVAAGHPPTAILDTTPTGNWRHAVRAFPGFLRSPYLAKGLRLLMRVRRAVRVVPGVTELAIEPGASCAAELVFHRGMRPAERMAADHVLLHQGVTPNVNLANAAGCALEWSELQACFRPRSDAWGRSSIEGIAITGDGSRIAGAEIAALRGQLAGLDAACELGRMDAEARDKLAAPIRARIATYDRGREFLDRLYRPSDHFRLPHDEALACRCEEVTGRQLREVAALGVPGPNQMKSMLRCGMGPCQGRLCGLTVVEAVAAARGVSPADVGYYRLRSPVKPITVAEIASMPRKASDEKAVLRV
ncbi:FAD-dependent oxidoreductase [Sabulicella rubraurantiaca]|uniref:FAD-dependent oxidoreductase n=1 Tax=Sabulicella rubraurantiaca TaxID=2811429 RepID=UPI001A960192|nr:FAD-dependent oxidoreductase [Sabulicella rubraurantiaca]